MLLLALRQGLSGQVHRSTPYESFCFNTGFTRSHVRNVHLNEGLVVQGGGGLHQPCTLLLVLLQSQRVDGEEGHVGLKGGATQTQKEEVSY